MFSCCIHAQAAAELFSRLAKVYRWRYRWLGLERSQRQLVAGLERLGFAGARILEIGCGVGCLHQWLVAHGAQQAVGVDLSARLLAEAEALARENGLAERVRYVQGDFLDLAACLEPVEIVILDKVICCYPDAKALLTQAVGNARRAVALTYPRAIWYNWFGIKLINCLLSLGGSEFRTFLHPPEAVASWLIEAGLEQAWENKTPVWLTQIFVRS